MTRSRDDEVPTGGGTDGTTDGSGRRGRRPSRYDFSTVTMTFRSGGERCHGRLFRPDRPADPALVVLTGGPPGVGAACLDPVAERLAAAGYAVFRFDGRNTGDSEGEPRNLVSPASQRADWEAALAGLRARGDVATDRVVLWGTDLAGGTALDVAAGDARIRAVVAQTPILSGRAFLRARGLGVVGRGVLAGVRDVLQSPLVGPHTIPVVGDGEGFALVPAPSARRGYADLASGRAADAPDSATELRIPARSVLALARDGGDDALDRITCPVLFVGGTRDDLTPIEPIEAAAAAVADATLVSLPTGHFDLYDGSGLDRLIGHGRAFLDAAADA